MAIAQLGRASAFQAEGCGFETRLPLQGRLPTRPTRPRADNLTAPAFCEACRCPYADVGQLVRAKGSSLSAGSNPAVCARTGTKGTPCAGAFHHETGTEHHPTRMWQSGKRRLTPGQTGRMRYYMQWQHGRVAPWPLVRFRHTVPDNCLHQQLSSLGQRVARSVVKSSLFVKPRDEDHDGAPPAHQHRDTADVIRQDIPDRSGNGAPTLTLVSTGQQPLLRPPLGQEKPGRCSLYPVGRPAAWPFEGKRQSGPISFPCAGIAQLAERRICNPQAGSPILPAGSMRCVTHNNAPRKYKTRRTL